MIINLRCGSLGMAYYRLLYVKVPKWVKYNIGERSLLVGVLVAGIFTSLVWTVMFGSGQSKIRAALNMCMQNSSHNQVNEEDFYWKP